MADSLETLICPACKKEMVKIFIPSEGINIDICLNGCGGIYFDNREFKKFDEQHENIDEILNAIKDKEFVKVDESQPRNCPVCGAVMRKNYASPKQLVEIDECYSCGGKFLDNGELQKIRDEYKTEADRTTDIMQQVYSTVGVQINELDKLNEVSKKKRSLAKKLFDFMIYRD